MKKMQKMKETTCSPCCSKRWAPLILRMALGLTFLPYGLSKTFGIPLWGVDFGGYAKATQIMMSISADVAPVWLGMFMAYTLPVLHLYNSVALILGFGKKVTKFLVLFVTFSLLSFWMLKSGAKFEWFMNPHTWFFISAVVLLTLPGFGKWSLDKKLFSCTCCATDKK